MALEPSKRGHPSVPRKWMQIGEGGNSIVWKDGEFAVKRLKNNVSGEARERFHRESLLMMEMKDRSDLKVVPVVDVRQREDQIEIVMEALDGNLENVIDQFQCQPSKAANALLPIVKTLAILSEGNSRIHHRDVKPSNILFKATETNLFLGDFGCAYLAGSDRITPDNRALGAWAYRPPEYSGPRIEEVDEKGDVFSLGKVLWSMINGYPKVTFPGAVWFQPEYDLTSICPEGSKVAEAMYVIGKCCSIRPDNRLTLVQLLEMLANLASNEKKTDKRLKSEALKREQEQEIEYEQRFAIARSFVTRLVADFGGALEVLHSSYPESLRLDWWLNEWNRLPNRSDSLVKQVAVQESDAPLMNIHRRRELLNTRFFPEGMDGPLRFRVFLARRHGQEVILQLTVEARDSGLVAILQSPSTEPVTNAYDADTFADFLLQAINMA